MRSPRKRAAKPKPAAAKPKPAVAKPKGSARLKEVHFADSPRAPLDFDFPTVDPFELAPAEMPQGHADAPAASNARAAKQRDTLTTAPSLGKKASPAETPLAASGQGRADAPAAPSARAAKRKAEHSGVEEDGGAGDRDERVLQFEPHSPEGDPLGSDLLDLLGDIETTMPAGGLRSVRALRNVKPTAPRVAPSTEQAAALDTLGHDELSVSFAQRVRAKDGHSGTAARARSIAANYPSDATTPSGRLMDAFAGDDLLAAETAHCILKVLELGSLTLTRKRARMEALEREVVVEVAAKKAKCRRNIDEAARALAEAHLQLVAHAANQHKELVVEMRDDFKSLNKLLHNFETHDNAICERLQRIRDEGKAKFETAAADASRRGKKTLAVHAENMRRSEMVPVPTSSGMAQHSEILEAFGAALKQMLC
ncbi:hypothetical protein T492DRAFT_973893 [Pavlovales sp. CCMP2436]|nr:hypothetical protein T492DRAFT_973893 [Pavlovales sp. CCMP2436]